ncbi:MAG: EAL domain-containing protein [Hyphomonadaceae bacterium]|nr:EAL domain-containing protein [Hyphomonadaceae bacterium]
MQVRSLAPRSQAPTHKLKPAERLLPVIDLKTLTTACALYENARAYDDAVRFGPARMGSPSPCPADWLASQIDFALAYAHASQTGDRPIHISAPASALTHRDTAETCLRAVASQHGCPQEICLEFENASFSADPISALAGARTLRRAGFRIGVDARRSSCALSNPALHLLIDVAHIDAGELGFDLRLARRVETAREEGVAMIAHGAAWKDQDLLVAAGVDQVVNASADA